MLWFWTGSMFSAPLYRFGKVWGCWFFLLPFLCSFFSRKCREVLKSRIKCSGMKILLFMWIMQEICHKPYHYLCCQLLCILLKIFLSCNAPALKPQLCSLKCCPVCRGPHFHVLWLGYGHCSFASLRGGLLCLLPLGNLSYGQHGKCWPHPTGPFKCNVTATSFRRYSFKL